MNIDELLKIAYEDLQKVSDPYQHGMLAVSLAAQLKDAPVIETSDTNKDASAPKADNEPAKLQPMTKSSEKIASVMQDAAKKAESNTETDLSVIMTPTDPEPAPKAEAPQTQDDAAYYDSDEWKNKHLNSQELDATWTDRMKKNGPLMKDMETLKSFVQYCAKSNMVDWLNQTIAKLTDNHFNSAQETQLYMPKMVSFILAGLKKGYYDYQQQQNKAA